MTEEETKAAEAKALAEAAAAKDGKTGETIEVNAIEEKDKEIKKLTEERDNYKNVALKRLGKLPGDAAFLSDDTSELSVAEQVRLALLDKEIEARNKAKDDEARKLVKENAELRLALKNRPETSIGSGDDTAGIEVKDNILSADQILGLKAKALQLKVDPEKFIENFKKNLKMRQ